METLLSQGLYVANAEQQFGVNLMAEARSRYVNHLFNLLREYEDEVNASPLSISSKVDYIYFAECFVRWLDHAFEPGANVKFNWPREGGELEDEDTT